uniref:Uncharacterized protein n=1 Tax=Arundo donax TaxID=35708 RepID=A0A0A9AMI8_ARUDO
MRLSLRTLPGCNANAHGHSIIIGVVAYPGDGTTHVAGPRHTG